MIRPYLNFDKVGDFWLGFNFFVGGNWWFDLGIISIDFYNQAAKYNPNWDVYLAVYFWKFILEIRR